MKYPQDKFEQLKLWIEALETPSTREAYRNGNFPRSEAVKDINKRYRWDLYWAAMYRFDPSFEFRDSLPNDLLDSHIDTALKRIVRPL